MINLTHALLILVAAMLAGRSQAFDAPPPPNPKTMEWTIEQANYLYPMFDVRDTKASEIIKWLDSSMNTPGFYLDIDKSEVEALLDKKLSFKVEKIRWLSVLGKVADAIDADIQITPGKIKLVPKKKNIPAIENK